MSGECVRYFTFTIQCFVKKLLIKTYPDLFCVIFPVATDSCNSYR